ncbi:MAG: TonB-dependent receptor [Methylophilaceae bacterium]|nr:TonB-dependent siderophore receptor [Methylophilaceae bacterium]
MKTTFNLRPHHAALLLALAAWPAQAAEYAKSDVSVTETGAEATLPEVSVQADTENENRYQPLTTKTAAKIEAELRDIPQTVNVIPETLFRDQGARSMNEVLRNVPGVGFSNGDGQRDQVTIRGFSAIADQFIDGVRDDALYFRELANIEQVEVLKGPASVLYGRGSSGGLINRITKKPTDDPFTNVTTTVGSWDMKRVEVDSNQPLGEAAAFRINAAVEDSGSFRDQGFTERNFIAPSLQLNISEKTKLLFQVENLEDKRVTDFGVPAINGRPVNVDPETYYGSSDARDDDYTETDILSGAVTLEHEFNNGWKLKNTFRASDYDLNRNNTVAQTVNTSTLTVTRRHSFIDRQEHGYFNQTDISTDASWLGLKHALLFGMELGYQDKDAQSGNYANPGSVSLYDPQSNDNTGANRTVTASTRALSKVAGFYVQDLITLSSEWKALVGVRHDRFDQTTENILTDTRFGRTDTEFSPRAGLVYQPTPWASVYASYTQSFQPSQEVFALAANNTDIAPEETTNYEVGTKLDFLGGNLSAMVSLFRLERTNIKSVDPTDTTKLIPVGEQRTDGLELSLSGRPAHGWDITAGYAFLDAEITESPTSVGVPISATGASYLVAIEGNRPSLTPRHSANLWVTRRFDNGFGLGGGVTLMGEQFASVSNEVKLPGYARADMTAFYETKKYEVRLLVNNIFDREYFESAHGSVDIDNTPGAPRNAQLSLKLKF